MEKARSAQRALAGNLGNHRPLWLQWYRTMLLIREFEDALVDLYKRNRIRGSLHLSRGQEAVAVGACAALRRDDVITTTYRGHGHCLAKGADPGRMLAELLGKRTGLCAGKGGKMHLTDMTCGILGANGIVAAGIPLAAGAALAARLDGSDQVAAAFFGDGATNQGVFHETLNMAAIWTLPLVLICENNLYSEMTPIRCMVNIDRLSSRKEAYGMEGVTIDGNDVAHVYETVQAAVQRARSGGGPTFIEALTYRLSGHMQGDSETYRPRDEVERWAKQDPITRLRDGILTTSLASPEVLETLAAAVRQDVAEACAFAESQADPDPAQALTNVYA